MNEWIGGHIFKEALLSIIQLNDQTFSSTIANKTEKYILVDFWAEWCGPCRMLAPVLEAISVDFSKDLLVYKLNTDDSTQTAQLFNITSIPCCILFKDGKEIHRLIGYKTRDSFAKELSMYMI